MATLSTRRNFLLPIIISFIPAFLISYMILHLDIVKIVGIFGILSILVVSAIKVDYFIYILLGLKPFIDLTWSTRFFSVSQTSLSALHLIGFYVFLFAGYFYFFYRDKNKIYNERIIWIFILVHILSSFVAIFVGSYTFIDTVDSLLRIFDAYFAYFIFYKLLKNEKNLMRVIGVIWVSTFFLGILSVMTYSEGNYNIDVSQQVVRFAGLYNDPGTPAYISIMSLVFGTLFVEKSRNRGSGRTLILTFYFATVLMVTYLLRITLTKSAIVMLIVFLVLWFGLFKKKLIVVVPLMIAFGYFAYTASEGLRTRLKTEVDFFQDGAFSIEAARPIGSGRVGYWERLITIYKNRFTTYQKLFGSARTYGAHNQYLAYLMQVGIVGLGVFLIILSRFYWRLYCLYKRYRKPELYMSMVVLTIFSVYGMTGHPFEYTTLLWYLMLLLSLINMDYRIFSEKTSHR
jgi:hypothetical protein